MKIYVILLALGCLLAMSVYAAQKGAKEEASVFDFAGGTTKQKAISLKTEMDKVSYVIGAQLGQKFKAQGIEIKIEPLIGGLKDTMAGKKLALSQDEIQQVLVSFQQRMKVKQEERRKAEAAKNLAEGTAFLEVNKAKKGVKVLPSGLQYKVVREGTGKSPTVDDKVKAQYRGIFINGKEFDSSYKRNKPSEFLVKGVMKGWTEALQLMKEGSKWELYIPADLAYGEQGRRNIPPNSTLLFEIELLEVVKLNSPSSVTRKLDDR